MQEAMLPMLMKTKPKIEQDIRTVLKREVQEEMQDVSHPEKEINQVKRENYPVENASKIHTQISGCTNFKKYLPGEPNGSNSISKEICMFCLGTVFSNCLHSGMPNHPKYHCNKYNIFFLVATNVRNMRMHKNG